MYKGILIIFICIVSTELRAVNIVLESIIDTIPFPFSKNTNKKNKIYLPVDSINYKYNSNREDIVENKYIGNIKVSYPNYISRKSYSDIIYKKKMKEYFRSKSYVAASTDKDKRQLDKNLPNLLPKFKIPSEFLASIFGGDSIELIPKGYVMGNIGMLHQYIDNPHIPKDNRSSWNLDFDQDFQFSLGGTIGKNFSTKINYDTDAIFDFQNLIKLNLKSDEDDIIKDIDFGNISMPIESSLITGAQNLYGIKARMQFGKLFLTTVFSEKKSKSKVIQAEGGDLMQKFNIRVDEYDDNKHFFLAKYFYDKYDEALENYPYINSNINIIKVEVWVTNTNTTSKEGNRNVLAFMDLGEKDVFSSNVKLKSNLDLPFNEINSLDPSDLDASKKDIRNIYKYKTGLSSFKFLESTDYIQIQNARKLKPNQYKFNNKLGYISLNERIGSNEVLAVAFQYSYKGKIYQVGEFSSDFNDISQNLYVKLLKSNVINTNFPVWDLMMKNIYSLESKGINKEDFVLDIVYASDKTGTYLNYIEESKIEDEFLLRVFGLDRLDYNNNASADGYFDFVEDITIDPEQGNIIFTKVQPFGSYLADKLDNEQKFVDKYVFNDLYDTLKSFLTQKGYLSKFYLKGKYKSSSGGQIFLGAANIPKGSVIVQTNGRKLVEGLDYIVDYQLGRVSIINQNILDSKSPITVSLENNSDFDINTRTFLGLKVDYKFSDKFTLGATALNSSVKPLVNKNDYKTEPINNTILGVDFNYKDEFITPTEFLDNFLFIDKDIESTLSWKGEFAYFIPGINSHGDGNQDSYIDAFDYTNASIDIKNPNMWFLASTPSGSDQDMFPESNSKNLSYGFNRARLAWYYIDPIFYTNSSEVPSYIRNDKSQLSSNQVRNVLVKEIKSNIDITVGMADNLSVLNLAYYPNERGSYNFDINGVSGISRGIDSDGKLKDADTRWAGIMRSLKTNDFEQSNIEYIQFWLMDPYDGQTSSDIGGDLYIHLGSVSEDILKDGRKMFENGLGEGVTSFERDIWGNVPTLQSFTYSFENDPNIRRSQDIGLDGLNNREELQFYSSYLDEIKKKLNNETLNKFIRDISNDDFLFYLSPIHDKENASILDRYKFYNNTQSNSVGSPNIATNDPDMEDIDRNSSMSSLESYYEYKVSLFPNDLVVGKNNIADKKISTVDLVDGSTRKVTWYQFKIPIYNPDKSIGGISNYSSMRFIRMILKNFKKDVVLRFGTMELMRNQWRQYTRDMKNNLDQPVDNSITSVQVSSIGIVEASSRDPIPYKLPPGIIRENLFNNTAIQRQDERSLSLKVCGLRGNDIRAVYKRIDLDLRRFSAIKMYAHLESIKNEVAVKDDQMSLVIRFGNDFLKNYYEYEIPLDVTSFGQADASSIWPTKNNVDIKLKDLKSLKIDRDKLLGISTSIDNPYSISKKDKIYTIVGQPNYSNIKVMMIGIKNNTNSSKCAEMWVNELRLSGIDKQSGWAVKTDINSSLSDFGSVAFAGFIKSYGFGPLEQSLQSIDRNKIETYDFTTSIDMGKAFPKGWGLNVPVTYGIIEKIKTPEYNPINSEIRLDEMTDEERKDALEIAEDYTRRTTIAVNNFSKSRTTEATPSFYDIENLSASFFFNETYRKDIELSKFLDRHTKGNLTYDFNLSPFNVRPLYSLDFLSNNWLNIIRDINFYYLPSKIYFSVDLSRKYTQKMIRNIENPQFKTNDFYKKIFDMDWKFNFVYNLTRALKFEINSDSHNIIDEPKGDIDTQEERDIIWNNLMNLGRANKFHQNFLATYFLPLSDIPIFKWIDIDLSYSADFDWQSGIEFVEGEGRPLGNIIQNNNNITIRGVFNLNSIYNDFEYINRIKGTTDLKTWDYLFMMLLSLNDFSLTYSENNGTVIHGYLPESGFFGFNMKKSYAPTVGFVLGDQSDIRDILVRRGWLTKDTRFEDKYQRVKTSKIDFVANFEILPNFEISLSANRSLSKDDEEIFKYSDDDNKFRSFDNVTKGNFGMSYNMLSTSNISSQKIYSQIKANTRIIANRLASDHYKGNIVTDPETGYPEGFSSTHQMVLINSFLAAYSGTSAQNMKLDPFIDIPMLNWRLTYNGLSNFEFIKKAFNNISISHSYESDYKIDNFINDVSFDSDNAKLDKSNNFRNKYIYDNISLAERFSPLIGLELETINNISLKFEIASSRQILFTFSNIAINEMKSSEYVLGVGYRFKDVGFTIRTKNRRRKFSGDIRLRLDASIKDDKISIRRFKDDFEEITGGQLSLLIKFTADYSMTRRFNLRLYYNHDLTNYKVSNSFDTYNIRFGFGAKYIIGN